MARRSLSITALVLTLMLPLVVFGPRLHPPQSLALAAETNGTAEVQSRPNILFIQTDDQAATQLDEMKAVQNRVKAYGRSFPNAHNSMTLCCPSRVIEQRGQYAHNTQVWGNDGQEVDSGGYETFHAKGEDKSTYAVWLRNAGYYTGHFGKYMNGYDSYRYPPPPGWNEFGEAGASAPEFAARIQEGPYAGEPRDRLSANAGIDFLHRRAPSRQPFFLQMDFHAPHVPSVPEASYRDDFPSARVPRLRGYNEQDVSDKPRYIREDKPPLASQQNTRVTSSCTDNESNSVEQNDCEYRLELQALQTVDDFVDEALDYLRSQGELDNTYIVFYSDNGNHWGEHRLDYGKLTPYATDSNFPLFIRGPGIPPGYSTRKLISNIDLAPTFADMANATAPSFVDGRSFLQVAKNPASVQNWRTVVFGERETRFYRTLPDKDSAQYVPAYEAIYGENSTFVRYKDDAWTPKYDPGFKELYDHRKDPTEVYNLYVTGKVPEATTESFLKRLRLFRGCQAAECRRAEN